MKRKGSIVTVLVALIVVSAVALGVTKGIVRAEGVEDKAKEIVKPVPVVEAVSCDNVRCRDFPGVVRASKRVEMGFNIGGIITELQAKEGKAVKKGEVLVRLDDKDCKNALASAEAVLKEATQKYLRAKKLREEKIISKSEYDKSLATWEIAKAKIGVCEKNLADTVLVAPYDGIIAARYTEQFERISAGQEVLSIQDVSTVEVVIQVPESMIAGGGVESFKKTSFSLTADKSNRYYDCEVTEFRCTPDKSTKAYNVIFALDAPENSNIMPGMTADVKVEFSIENNDVITDAEQMIMVPIGSLWCDNSGKTNIWIIPESNGTPVATEVEVEDLEQDFAKIRGKVRPGQFIAVAGVNTLEASMTVCPKDSQKKGLEG